jgi:hypothetical protein
LLCIHSSKCYFYSEILLKNYRNYSFQTQLFEATSIIANLKGKVQSAAVIEPPENSEILNENEEKTNPGDEKDIPSLAIEKSLSPTSDFSFVQPHGVTLEVEDDTRLEVEPSSLVCLCHQILIKEKLGVSCPSSV